MNNPKYVRIFSDIHLDFDIPSNPKKFNPEFGLWTPEELSTDKETILILAGDLWHSKKPFSYMGFSWIKFISEKFHSVLIVLGNHDFWGGSLQKEYSFYAKSIQEQNLNNVHLIQNSSIVIGDNKFIGGTLWTNYHRGNPITMQLAESQMNDFKYIRYGMTFAKLKSNHLLGEHIKTIDFIEQNSVKDYPEQNLWVLTHHLPSFLSIPDDRNYDENHHENAMCASDLEHYMKLEIDVWVHGHSHEQKDYFIDKTRILSNPRGYVGEDTGYNPWAKFDFKGNLV